MRIPTIIHIFGTIQFYGQKTTTNAFSRIFLEHRFSCRDNSMGSMFFWDRQLNISRHSKWCRGSETVETVEPDIARTNKHVEPTSNRHFQIQVPYTGTVQVLVDSKLKFPKVEKNTKITCLRNIFPTNHISIKIRFSTCCIPNSNYRTITYLRDSPPTNHILVTVHFSRCSVKHTNSTMQHITPLHSTCKFKTTNNMQVRDVECGGNVERCFVHKSCLQTQKIWECPRGKNRCEHYSRQYIDIIYIFASDIDKIEGSCVVIRCFKPKYKHQRCTS